MLSKYQNIDKKKKLYRRIKFCKRCQEKFVATSKGSRVCKNCDKRYKTIDGERVYAVNRK